MPPPPRALPLPPLVPPFASHSLARARLSQTLRPRRTATTPAGETSHGVFFTHTTHTEATPAAANGLSLSQVERDLAAVDALGLTLKYCLNTHCHADHITGSGEIKKQKPGVQSLIAEASGAKADVQLKHGDTVSMGAVQVRCDRPVGSGVEGWGQGHGRCERLQATGWC